MADEDFALGIVAVIGIATGATLGFWSAWEYIIPDQETVPNTGVQTVCVTVQHTYWTENLIMVGLVALVGLVIGCLIGIVLREYDAYWSVRRDIDYSLYEAKRRINNP